MNPLNECPILLIVLIVSPFLSNAQRVGADAAMLRRLDSLKSIYYSEDSQFNNEERAATCRLIGVEFAAENRQDSALYWFDRAVELARDSFALARYHKGRAIHLIQLNRMEEVPEAVSLAKSYLPKPYDEMELSAYESILGSYCSMTGRFEGAFRHYYKLLEFSRRLDNPFKEYIALLGIGVTCYKVYDSQSAIKFWERAKRLASEGKFELYEYQKALPATNIALAYNEGGEFRKAIACVNELFIGNAGLPKQNLMEGCYAMGSAYLSLQNFDSARIWLRKSLKLSKEKGDVRYIAENCHSLGEINTSDGSPDSARFFLREAEEIATTGEFQDIEQRIYRTRVRLESKEQNLSAKLLYQKKLVRKSDELFHLTMSVVIGGAIAHDLEEQFQESLALENAISETNDLKHGKVIMTSYFQVALLIGLFLLIALAFRERINSLMNQRRLVRAIGLREAFLSKQINAFENILRLTSSQILVGTTLLSEIEP